jgi:uncharacterized protein YegL
MSSNLINSIIVIIVIVIIWFILRMLFRKLVEPNKVFIYGPGKKSDVNKLGFLAAEKKSTGLDSVLVDDKKLSNKEVAEIFVVEDQNKVEFRNILLIDNSGSTAPEIDEYKKALKSFVSTPFNGEKNALYTFSDKLIQRCDFTDSQTILINAIDSIEPNGATALNDSIIAVADLIATQEMLEQKDGKSIFFNIILFTDGLDNVSQTNKEDVIKRLGGKTLFAVCTKEADLTLMNELAKNPRNVFIIGGASNPQNTLGNAPSTTLEEALLKIRSEKLQGRGNAAYVQMKDEDNQFKIRGYVNVLGEVYSCGSQGEGAFFKALCENPGSEESKVFMGDFIIATRSNEDFNVESKGAFGISKNSLPITPTAMSAGAWVIYQLFKNDEKKSKPETLLNAFPKVAFFSLIIWCPIFILYWLLKYTTDINIFGWLGKEFDITITQILIFFAIWSIISALYVDVLKRKKKFVLFNDAINNIIGSSALSKAIIALTTIGLFLSIMVFYPFSYAAFFVCVLIAFSANLFLTHGGGKTWFINTQNPDFIPVFVGNESGTKVKIEFDYETSQGLSDNQLFEIKSNGKPNKFESIEAAVLDPQSKNILDYLENCVHITSIIKSYNPLSEAMMLAALGSLKSKPVNSVKNELNSSSKIVLLKDISLCDKLIFTLALFKEAAHELIYTSDYSSFAYRTPNKKGDSPYIFTYERKNYYYFTYNDKLNSYILTEPNDIENSIWINI